MAKQIVFEYEGKEYTLEYTRKAVEALERQGLVAEEITTKPMTVLPNLFAGAFFANHRSTNRDIIDNIYKKLTNKQALIEKLAELYNDTVLTLMEEPEDDGKNVNWEVR